LKARVVIYSKPGCHLCDEAKATIEQLASDAGYTNGVNYSLEVINIEREPSLFQDYKHDIPVILLNGIELFSHRVDEQKFLAALREALAERG
jgi:glutaredoxin